MTDKNNQPTSGLEEVSFVSIELPGRSGYPLLRAVCVDPYLGLFEMQNDLLAISEKDMRIEKVTKVRPFKGDIVKGVFERTERGHRIYSLQAYAKMTEPEEEKEV